MRAIFRFVFVIVWTISLSLSGETEEIRQLNISVDNVTPQANEYICASVSLPDEEQYVVGFQPEVTNKVHHLLLFACDEPYSRASHWDCKSMGGLCARSFGQIMYAWANHAEGLELPKDVGFKLGANVGVKSLVLQLHYGDLSKPGQADTSALTLTVTKKRPTKVAGVYVLSALGVIPAGSQGFSIEGSCTYSDQSIVPFAYRIHAHAHSTLITGFYRRKGGVEWQKLGSRSPQAPQGFYPVETHVTVHRGDILGAQCQYVTSNDENDIQMGPDTDDEMCNFYLMYYTANTGAHTFDNDCLVDKESGPAVPFPPAVAQASTPPTPPSPASMVNGEGEGHHVMTPPPLELASDWYLNGLEGDAAKHFLSFTLGQVSGVAVDGSGDVYVLHRGSRVWGPSSFHANNVFQHKEEGPIQEPVLLHLSSAGQLLHKMMANMFYLPHGLTVDNEGNIWITDVAMHQVFKFHPSNLSKPILTLGVPFQPGHDHTHFCKPSAVAVSADGSSFFVADGYCNRRIIKFSKTGEVLQIMNHPVRSTPQSSPKALYIPHSLALLDGGTKLMVADRENGRLITMATANLSHVVSVIENFNTMGHRLFAVAAPTTAPGATTPYVFVVNQTERFSDGAACGFTVDLKSKNIVQHWTPELGFGQPHDVAVSSDGEAVYVGEIGPNRVWKFSRHKAASTSEQARNRSIGFDVLYSNSTSQDGVNQAPIDSDSGDNNVTDSVDGDNESTGIVQVQDETNMPNQNWDDNLNDKKDNTATKEYECPTSVPPCNKKNLTATTAPIVPDESGFSTTLAAATNSTDAGLCPLSVTSLECIKLMSLHDLPALLLGVFFSIALTAMCAVAICLAYRKRCSCCNGSRVRKNLSMKAKQARGNMHSLLGPSHQGFVKVKTFDSDSEEEDVIFQQF